MRRTWRDGYVSVDGEDGEVPLVVISGSDGGGMIDVYNSLGTVVVSVQSDKTNQGAVYVNDVNGKTTNVLTTRP